MAGLDHDKAAEYYELRLLLEPRALKSSLSEADEDFLDEVRRAAAQLETAADLEAGFLAHRHFHQTLLSRCRNREMLRMCGILQDQTQRFAAHSVDLEHFTQHRALAAAVLAGDVDEAVRLIIAHLSHTADAAHPTGTALPADATAQPATP